MTVDSEVKKDVFAWFGSAAYAAQCLEVELCNLHILLYRLRNPSVSPDNIEHIDMRLSKKTLGTLLRELGKHFEIHPEFQALLDDYLSKRNYLMHHFFFNHARNLLSRDGCVSMVDELRDIHSSLKEADAIVQTMSRKMMKHLGISEEEAQAWIEEKLKKLGDTD